MPERTRGKTIGLMIGAFILYLLLLGLSVVPAIMSSSVALIQNGASYFQQHPEVAMEALELRNQANTAIPGPSSEFYAIIGGIDPERRYDLEELSAFDENDWVNLFAWHSELIMNLPTGLIMDSIAFTSLVLFFSIFIALYAFLWSREKKRLCDLQPVPLSKKTWACIALLMFSLNLSFSGLGNLLFSSARDHVGLEFMGYEMSFTMGLAVLFAMLTMVGFPLAEEFFFRGILFSRLRSISSRRGAQMTSALIFAVCHGLTFNAIAAFACGYVLADLFLRSGRLSTSILGHVAYNAAPAVMIVLSLVFPITARHMAILMPPALALAFYCFRQLQSLLPPLGDPDHLDSPYRPLLSETALTEDEVADPADLLD